MIRIEAPVVSRRNNRHILSARIRVEKERTYFPDTMWFAVSGVDPAFVPGLADPFLTTMVAAAMKMGADIRVEGRVSARLAYGLHQYQIVLHTWWPDIFRMVDIDYAEIDERRDDLRPQGVGCTFSGGLDSFHAVVDSLPANMSIKPFRITHAMMINGFDQFADLEHRGLARHMRGIYEPVLAGWGVKLLMIDTNLKFFRNAALTRAELVKSYNGPLASCAQALGGVFGRFGISGHGSYAHSDLDPYGSHPALDHHLGTDQLQILYAGSSCSRIQKLEMLADMPAVQQNLRVCFNSLQFDKRSGGVVNCGECEKCVRTLAGLMILDKLSGFTTFPRVLPEAQYQRPDILAAIHISFLEEMLTLAQSRGRQKWAESLQAAIQIQLRAETGQKNR